MVGTKTCTHMGHFRTGLRALALGGSGGTLDPEIRISILIIRKATASHANEGISVKKKERIICVINHMLLNQLLKC